MGQQTSWHGLLLVRWRLMHASHDKPVACYTCRDQECRSLSSAMSLRCLWDRKAVGDREYGVDETGGSRRRWSAVVEKPEEAQSIVESSVRKNDSGNATLEVVILVREEAVLQA